MSDDQDRQDGGDDQQGPPQKPSDEQKADEQKKQEEQKKEEEQKEEQKKRPLWPWFVAGAVVVLFVAVILILVLAPHPNVKTDDAYVTGHYAVIAPRVGGQIASVNVDDNQTVRAGQLLATVDERDYRTALEQSDANLEAARARVDQAGAQVARQPAFIDQSAAQVLAARARLGLAQADQRRYAALARTGAGTFQQHQQADTQLEQARASLIQAEADLAAQRRQLDALRADRTAALAAVSQASAAEHQARLNLGYTRIIAPIDGTVGQKTVEAGNFVSPGTALMTVVPLDRLYIMANYRELALRHMAPGQGVSIHVDAYDIYLNGVVASLPPASGATFSPIPPNNATGNFTKIVQRLPVKIVVAPNQPLARLLRAGMSVETVVHTGLANVVGAQSGTGARVTAQPQAVQP